VPVQVERHRRRGVTELSLHPTTMSRSTIPAPTTKRGRASVGASMPPTGAAPRNAPSAETAAASAAEVPAPSPSRPR
jgi:hypothetical protein